MFIHGNELSTFIYGFPMAVLLDKYRIYLLMSDYQLFFYIRSGLRKKLPVMILAFLEKPHVNMQLFPLFII